MSVFLCRVCGQPLTDSNWYPSMKIKHNYRCMSCHKTKMSKQFKTRYHNNKEHYLPLICKRRSIYGQKIKLEVLTHYCDGIPRCQNPKCEVPNGARDIKCLSVDHIDGQGNKQRENKSLSAGYQFYLWLRKNNYPEGYQVLCMNCQFIKRAEKKEYSNVKYV